MSSKIEIRIGRGAAGNGATDSVAAQADSAAIAADSAAPILAASDGASVADSVDTAADDRAPGAVIHRLDAAIGALDAVDFASWSDAALRGHLDEVSLVLCRVDAQLARLADAVRARGFSITEVELPLAS